MPARDSIDHRRRRAFCSTPRGSGTIEASVIDTLCVVDDKRMS
jgi:hypothetical protein